MATHYRLGRHTLRYSPGHEEKMIDKSVFYRAGYKYQLAKDLHAETAIRPDRDIDTEYIKLDTLGNLTIKEGYASDGPSGPTIDKPDSMRGAFIHDAKYQLIREQWIAKNWKATADIELRTDLVLDGMSKIKAELWYIGVRFFAYSATEPYNEPKVIEAP